MTTANIAQCPLCKGVGTVNRSMICPRCDGDGILDEKVIAAEGEHIQPALGIGAGDVGIERKDVMVFFGELGLFLVTVALNWLSIRPTVA